MAKIKIIKKETCEHCGQEIRKCEKKRCPCLKRGNFGYTHLNGWHSCSDEYQTGRYGTYFAEKKQET